MIKKLIYSNLKEQGTKVKQYKCPDCRYKATDPDYLVSHVEEEHPENIPSEWTTKRYIFNRNNKKSKGSCVICGKESAWNEKKVRYERFCDTDPNSPCVKKYKQRTNKDISSVHGTPYPAKTAEHQKKAQSGRSIKQIYVYKDGSGERECLGSYEYDLQREIDEKTIYNCNDLGPDKVIEYTTGDGESHFYMLDEYIAPIDLAIEVKDGSYSDPNRNTNPGWDREKEKAKDAEVIRSKPFNFIKICAKDYSKFHEICEILEKQRLDTSGKVYEKIIHIPE